MRSGRWAIKVQAWRKAKRMKNESPAKNISDGIPQFWICELWKRGKAVQPHTAPISKIWDFLLLQAAIRGVYCLVVVCNSLSIQITRGYPIRDERRTARYLPAPQVGSFYFGQALSLFISCRTWLGQSKEGRWRSRPGWTAHHVNPLRWGIGLNSCDHLLRVAHHPLLPLARGPGGHIHCTGILGYSDGRSRAKNALAC